MRLQVTCQLQGDNGDPIWGYEYIEMIPSLPMSSTPEEATDTMLKIGQEFLDRIDESKAKIGSQIAAEARHAGA